ncbi:MAG: UDP-N-acetylmuramoyl-tripeptide--D-alanyl-D-alanine ligase [Tannerella sp.]|jgi:UDP-N-acetylmuramoyl-tripeptide--D-alanyl-D-alanine ligase|nr:UDP-N-acetylmuramoyl-tripeptide--D-alanyl-D-alanine ligase [Tannerella sp.]
MDISVLYDIFLRCAAVTTDSRNCLAGSMFFALRGDNFDGNAFALKALEAGCAYAVVDNIAKAPQVSDDKRLIVVDDTLATLQELARLHRKTLGTRVICITGTNGKTTTKELTAAVLSKKFMVLYTKGNFNNHIGVPLTLLSLKPEHEIAVVEIGANHPGEIRDLAAIACPDFGLITNVGNAHLEGFGSFEGVVKTKGELYDYLRDTGGKIFVNANDEILTGMAAERCTVASYTTHQDSIPGALNIIGRLSTAHPYVSFIWRQNADKSTDYQVATRLVGSYNMLNALAAITIGVYFGVPEQEICAAIAEYIPTNNRSQLKQTACNTLIIDAYNANPSSMRATLENFASLKSSPKAVILGDMLELGAKSDELHVEILELIAASNIDKVLLVGEIFASATAKKRGNIDEKYQEFAYFKNVEDLAARLVENPLHGYNILIKGSHGIHLENIIELL